MPSTTATRTAVGTAAAAVVLLASACSGSGSAGVRSGSSPTLPSGHGTGTPKPRGSSTATSTAAPGTSPTPTVSTTARITSSPSSRPSRSGAPAVGPAGGPVPGGFAPQSVTFVSADVGWVLGTAPCSRAVCTSVLRTRDGGRTWTGIPAPTAAPGSPGQGAVSGLRFADQRNGWAYGTQLWATHDGGATWHRAEPSGLSSGGRIAAFAASGGSAYAYVVPGGSARGAGRLLRADVDSDRWATVASVASGPGGTAAFGFDGRSGLLLATGDGPTAAARLYRTSNGTTWTGGRAPCTGDLAPAGLARADTDPRTVVVTCEGESGAGSSTKQVYVSQDGGATFKATPTNPPRGGIGAAVTAPTSGSYLVAAASGAAFLYGSFDGGRSWQTVLRPAAPRPWNDLGFTTSSQGVVVQGVPALDGHGTLWLTRDGGHHWSAVRFAH